MCILYTICPCHISGLWDTFAWAKARMHVGDLQEHRCTWQCAITAKNLERESTHIEMNWGRVCDMLQQTLPFSFKPWVSCTLSVKPRLVKNVTKNLPDFGSMMLRHVATIWILLASSGIHWGFWGVGCRSLHPEGSRAIRCWSTVLGRLCGGAWHCRGCQAGPKKLKSLRRLRGHRLFIHLPKQMTRGAKWHPGSRRWGLPAPHGTATRTAWADLRRGDSWPSHPCVAQRALLAVTLW